MKRWKCNVCGYEQDGEMPPDICPLCRVGAEQFTEIKPAVSQVKKSWKCTVCDYIHVGDEPPDVCPLCQVGREYFVLLAAAAGSAALTPEAIRLVDESTARAALDTISYGLYIVSSVKDEKINGQCCNTVFQLTDRPLQVAVCLNKQNLTHEYVQHSGKLAITVLEEGDMAAVRGFGYRSGRSADKFSEVSYLPVLNGCPVLTRATAYLEGTVQRDKTADVGTHSLFVVSITAGRTVSAERPLTYAYFREHKHKQ